jgi:hypothetical protein
LQYIMVWSQARSVSPIPRPFESRILSVSFSLGFRIPCFWRPLRLFTELDDFRGKQRIFELLVPAIFELSSVREHHDRGETEYRILNTDTVQVCQTVLTCFTDKSGNSLLTASAQS